MYARRTYVQSQNTTFIPGQGLKRGCRQSIWQHMGGTSQSPKTEEGTTQNQKNTNRMKKKLGSSTNDLRVF